jgi:hypothetical protein
MFWTSACRKLLPLAALAAVLAFSGCDSPKPEKKAEVKKPAIPEGAITALTAYNEVWKVARTTAPDLQTASVSGVNVDSVKSGEGKFAQWKIVFVSASKQEAYTFLYSTVEQGNILRGLNNQGSMKWAGANQNATPFANSDFPVDSDAAYKAAAEKASQWLAKNPDKPVTEFALGNASSFPNPMWYVQWGDKKGGYLAYVNAATGKIFLRK